MNTISGAMIDEDVLEWLDDFNGHKIREMCEAINQLAYAHRTELSIPNMGSDEDLAALSHADLFTILSLACPDAKYDLMLSNVQLLGLALAAKGVIDYHLPELNSPILAKREFVDKHRKNIIGGISTRGQIVAALNEWVCGLRDLEIVHAGSDVPPDIAGMYLCLDEHEQVRYGRLFPNGSQGWTFCESYADGGSTGWYSGDTDHMSDDDLPMSLLTGWVLIAEWHSPSREVKDNVVPIGLSDTHRIFMFLRSLSPHVKAELVAHFEGVLDYKSPTSVDTIGRLTTHDWRMAAVAVADDSEIPDGATSWTNVPAWTCFVAVAKALGFNFETRQFDPQFEYQANDDHLEGE
ncbi:hypothetical protein pEaSNUABM3_00271 [Erwinia phage pEa_SNUABM_3]|uniref:Uncharacterized protein n=1 Tax=Erwinia phage pEa_SNUABM_3 TaxID=2869552 RepID=A0AAE7XLE7_9CAUD|nr:hypothetical protein MPK68_gp271 [Erwinia phage pEa_SNUABM_3]QZE56468.1 hypothetical protein pEaSNUABM3_00271 [Erwinia phage pEa_SNUABM_3]